MSDADMGDLLRSAHRAAQRTLQLAHNALSRAATRVAAFEQDSVQRHEDAAVAVRGGS
jgi:hypothetical protein